MQFPALSKRFHWQFDDPAHYEGTEEEILNEFRRIRDQMGKASLDNKLTLHRWYKTYLFLVFLETVFVAYGNNIVSGTLEPSFNFISDTNKAIVRDLINSADIVIFQSPTCPHCKQVLIHHTHLKYVIAKVIILASIL